ncbi:MAG: glycosyltransferase family 39 protein [Anaerolineae bacterium]|nr:glycosyltransferase family 39 protein [Anaerolineae bacterium]
MHNSRRCLRRCLISGLVLAAGIVCFRLGAVTFGEPNPDHLTGALQLHSRAFSLFAVNDLDQGMTYYRDAQPVLDTPELARGAGYVAAGMILVLIALAVWRLPDDWRGSESRAAAAPAAPRLSWWPVVPGGIALALLCEANTPLLKWDVLVDLSADGQFMLLCAGIMLITWGMSGVRWPRLPRLARRDGLALLLVTALAFVLRVWNIGGAVHHLIDELNFVAAINMFDRPTDPRLLEPFSPLAAFPYVFPYLQAKAVSLLGRDFAAIRAVSVILGSLTVPALYALARVLFNARIALLAALLLAVFPPHIHFSRLGINNIADPLFGVLMLAFLARGLRDNRRADFAAAGAMLGLTQYFYEGGRLFYPVLVIVWLVGLRLVKRPDDRQIPGRGLVIGLLTALIAAAPVYVTLARSHQAAAPRMEQVGLSGHYLVDHLLLSANRDLLHAQAWHTAYGFLSFVYLPDESWFYRDSHALLMPAAIPLFLLGLTLALWRWRQPGALLVLLWLVGGALSQAVMIRSAWYPRYVVVFPAVPLALAIGVWGGVSRLVPLGQAKIGRWARIGAAGVLVIALGVGQVRHYFGPYLDRYTDFIGMPYDAEDAVYRSLDFPPGTHVHIVADVILWYSDIGAMLEFWQADLVVHVIAPRDFSLQYLRNLSPGVDHAFYIEPPDDATRDLLKGWFFVEAPQYSPYNVPWNRQLALYYVPDYLPPLDSFHPTGEFPDLDND